jgi:hypothetical protein
MAFQGRSMYPGGDQGYTRPGNDFAYGGTGSGTGFMAQGTASLGQGLGPLGSMAGSWEPGPVYLIGLIIAEMILFHILSRVLSR